MEIARAQNRNIELEGLLVEFSEWDQKIAKELKEKSETVARLEEEVCNEWAILILAIFNLALQSLLKLVI